MKYKPIDFVALCIGHFVIGAMYGLVVIASGVMFGEFILTFMEIK